MARRMKAWFALAIVVMILGLGVAVSSMYSFTVQAQNDAGTEFVIQQSTATPLPPTATPLPPTATPTPTPTSQPKLHLPFIQAQ